jgi:hypothetical protein
VTQLLALGKITAPYFHNHTFLYYFTPFPYDSCILLLVLFILVEHRASTTFSSEAVAEVSIVFKFFIEAGLLALCSNPQLGGPGLPIYIS